jgi:large subunit ribosomal protein L30
MKALGLGKLNRPVEHEAVPEVLGMVRKLQHLLRVEEVNE